jgi:hypothetical protein
MKYDEVDVNKMMMIMKNKNKIHTHKKKILKKE